MNTENTGFSDETLTAYLDGELDTQDAHMLEAALETDEGLAERLAALNFPMAAFRQVMSPDVLAAPELPEKFAAAAPATPQRSRPKSFVPLALVASFLVGMVATTLIVPAPSAGTGGWTTAVASYQALYVTETLAAPAQDGAATDAVLSRAAEEFDVALAPALQIDGLSFKRAQMLGFEGKPLLQMAYLTLDGTPVALCLTRTTDADRGPEDSVIFDLAGVSWVKNGVGYFLIGGDDADVVGGLSKQVLAAI